MKSDFRKLSLLTYRLARWEAYYSHLMGKEFQDRLFNRAGASERLKYVWEKVAALRAEILQHIRASK